MARKKNRTNTNRKNNEAYEKPRLKKIKWLDFRKDIGAAGVSSCY